VWRESNSRPFDPESDTRTTTPPSHMVIQLRDLLRTHTETCWSSVEPCTGQARYLLRTHTETCWSSVETCTGRARDLLRTHTETCWSSVETCTGRARDLLRTHTETCWSSVEPCTGRALYFEKPSGLAQKLLGRAGPVSIWPVS